MNDEETVVICEDCQGYGKDYLRVDPYESGYEKCSKCKGSGMLLRKVTYEPFKQN